MGIRLFGLGRTDCRVASLLAMTECVADAGVAADYPWRPCRIEVPVYRGLPHPLWGITARITMDVVDKL